MKGITWTLLLTVIAISTDTQLATLAQDAPKTVKQQDRDANLLLQEAWWYGSGDNFHAIGSGDVWTAKQETLDSFDKVWAFYSKKCGYDKPYEKMNFVRTNGKTNDGRNTVLDAMSPTNRTHSVFVYDSPRHTITATVFRGDGIETPTRIWMTVINRER